MDKYKGVSDHERRKLLKDFNRAVKEIPVSPPRGEAPQPDTESSELQHQGLIPGSDRSAAKDQADESRIFESRYRRRRPSYWKRVRIDNYAYTRGFEVCGLKQFLASLLSFLRPARDIIHNRFVKSVIMDDPYKSDPSGYSLSRTVLELKACAELLMTGGAFFKRVTDGHRNGWGELTRDLLYWQPFGFKLIRAYAQIDLQLLDTLDFVKHKYDHQRAIDAFDLADIIKAVYVLSLRTDSSFSVLKDRVKAVGELIVSFYKRLYSGSEKIQQVQKRIDSTVNDFLSAYARLKWFARQLYPALLKLLNLFQEEDKVHLIAEQIYHFIGLNREEILKPETESRQKEEFYKRKERVREALSAQPEIDISIEEEYRGILKILSYAFPGSLIEKIAGGDYSALFWFHQKIFNKEEHHKRVIAQKPDFLELLWKIAADDPMSPIILLHEIIGRMLAALAPESLSRLAKPLAVPASVLKNRFLEIKVQWPLARSNLFERYLEEIDYFEKETSLVQTEHSRRFADTAAGRKTVEIVNQIRNHVIRGYGYVTVGMNRKEYFGCRPLYSLNQELLDVLEQLNIDRSQLIRENPLIIKILEQENIVLARNDPIIRQIKSYIDTIPKEKRLLEGDLSESQRLFLEILYGLADLLQFFLNNSSPKIKPGGEVVFAGKREQEIREEIEKDKSPLRIELRKDFEEVDQLTGLLSKNEYLRIIPELFKETKENEGDLSFLVIDLDHLKAVNDAKGHDFGDEILQAAALVIRSSMRQEDLAVRFGGEEMLIILRGDYQAGIFQAERIRSSCSKLLSERYPTARSDIPIIMADKQYREEKKDRPHFEGRLEEYLKSWQNKPIGTLSIGVAQGLGEELPGPCGNEKQAFIRADKMLYLAKESGRNRVVAMVDALKIPLSYSEFIDYLDFLGNYAEIDPLEFIKSRAAGDKRLSFYDYLYTEYSAVC